MVKLATAAEFRKQAKAFHTAAELLKQVADILDEGVSVSGIPSPSGTCADEDKRLSEKG